MMYDVTNETGKPIKFGGGGGGGVQWHYIYFYIADM